MADTVRVLYAEDNLADAELTRTHFALNAPDIALEIVETGQRCLARLKPPTCDVLLLDNRLPDMEGLDVVRDLASKDVLLPIVMVTGAGDEELVVQALRLGVSDYVSKEGDYLAALPGVLRQALSDFRERHGHDEWIRARSRHILYVERHVSDIDLTRTHFTFAAPQFRLDVVHTSTEALAALQSGSIDLILADLRLPDLDALQLLREMKHADVRVPLIVVTGRGDEQVAVAALKLGASDYIVKRKNYLVQLPYAIENAIARSQLARANERLKRELSERERLAAENARLLEEARGAVRARDEFLAIAAHEIRGPLMSIRLGSQSLQSRKLPAPAFGSVIDIIGREEQRLARFVDELLDLGRIRAAPLQLSVEHVDLETLVREVVQRFSGELAKSGSTVTIAVQGTIAGQWDRARVDQVVTNLLSNAIKFGLGRPIDITLSAKGVWANLRMTDRGIGIPEERREEVFEPFHRETSARNYGGLGLGLYIARTIVDALGGRLRIEGDAGNGSTLVLELPRTNAGVTQ
jgi:signal transduction histidine kinase